MENSQEDKYEKKVIAVLVCVSMILMMIPFQVFAETTTIESGECGANGSNVVWKLNSNTLTISGTGAMEDYTWTNFVPTTPWYQYRSSIKKIIVEDGVASIGSTAFYKLSYATSVEITNDVLAFGSYAFASCSNIQNIDFPDNLKYIANYCFEDCRSLSSIVIPETVTKLGDCVFTGCTKLVSIKLPSSMTVLPRGFFSECTSLESIVIPDGVTEFISNCFRDCTSLKSVVFPKSLNTIGYRVFAGCTGLEEVKLPDTVTTLSSEVFYNCSGLIKLTLPQNLQTVSTSLCYGCTKLQSIEIPTSVISIEDTAFSNCTKLNNVILYEGLEKIGTSVFYKCTGLSNIVIPKSVTSIGKNAYGFYKNIYDETDIIPGAKMYCYAGSVSETYAKENGIPFSLINIIVNQSECEYTGNPVTPNVIITIDGKILENGNDYTVSYENNINVGTTIANITFLNDYASIKGTVKKSYRIGKLIGKCEIILDKETYQYHMQTPDVTIKSEEKTLEVGIDYDVYYTLAGQTWKKLNSNTYRYLWELGKCDIKIVGINGYIGEETVHVNISKFDMANAHLMTTWSSTGDGSYGSSSYDMKNFEYNGKEKKQSGFRVCDKNDTIDSSNYDITYKNNIEVGTATMVITGKGEYYTGTLEKEFNIYSRPISSIEVTKNPNKLIYHKDKGTIDVSGGQITICYQDGNKEKVNMTANMIVGDYNLSKLGYQNIWLTYMGYSVCYKVQVVSHTNKLTTTKATLTKNGSVVNKCTVCGNVSSTTTIKYAKSFILSTTTYTYNGKAKTPSVVVKDSAGKTLKKNTDYTVSYASGLKNVGTYKVTIMMKGNYSGTKTLTFKINPANTAVSKLTAGKKSITVAITKKSTQVTGYQIQYSTSKKFTNAKTKTISSYKTTKYTLKSLKAKKTYYVRVRTYKTVGNTKYYSGWSTYKYVKTK